MPARRLLGGPPGDRASARFAEWTHHATWSVLDEPLPPISQGRILGATLDAEQGAALGVAAVAASLSTREIARVNAAIAREQLFASGWSFTEPRLVLLPGRILANGGFQLAACNWPIPPRVGGG